MLLVNPCEFLPHGPETTASEPEMPITPLYEVLQWGSHAGFVCEEQSAAQTDEQSSTEEISMQRNSAWKSLRAAGDAYLRKMLGISQLLSQPIEEGLGQTKTGATSHQPEKEIYMKQLNSTMICGLPVRVLDTLAIVALLMGLSVLPAAAADKGCSDASLKGDYAYAVNGTSVTIPPVGLVAILGKITADGKGSFSGSVNGSIAGIVILTDVPITGTYGVASDCTGTLTTDYPGFTAHFSLVLVEDSKRAQLVETDAGAVGTGTVNPVSIHAGQGEPISN